MMDNGLLQRGAVVDQSRKMVHHVVKVLRNEPRRHGVLKAFMSGAKL